MRATLRRGWRRLLNVMRWRRIQRDLREELQSHMSEAAERYEALGMTSGQAWRQARREFGGEDRWLEVSRRTRGVPVLQDVLRDTRIGLRSYRRAPGFAIAAVLVIALGIGATTAVFSIARSVLLRPLPYADPASLYEFNEATADGGLRTMSYPTYEEVAAESDAVVDLAYTRGESVIVRTTDGTQALLGAYVTPNFFALLGESALAGRALHAADGDADVVILSWRIATRMFGDAESALGRSLITRDGSYTVLGVMPPGFAYPEWADVWLPLNALRGDARFALTQRNLHVDSRTIARLRPGIRLSTADAQLDELVRRMAAAYPEPGAEFDRAQLTPLREQILGNVGGQYAAIAGAVVLVLLLACVNVASLVLARGLARRAELSVRLAVGAGRGRLIRQLLTESLVLALLGGAVGAALAWVAVSAVRIRPPVLLPRSEEVAVDGTVLAFALAVSIGSALLFGAVPALRATAAAQASVLRAGGRGTGGDRATTLMRSGLVVTQVAVAVVLLVGATLLLRTARAIGEQDLGFDAAGLLALRVVPPAEYGDEAAALAFFEQLRSTVAAVPGVEGAELANHIPLSGAWMPTPVRTERTVGVEEPPLAVYRTVSPEYLDLLGARLRHGQSFSASNSRGTGVIVNRTLARREWGEADPLGEQLTIYRSAQGRANFGEPMPSYVLGVIEDIHEFGATTAPPAAVYVPLERNVWPNVYLVVRARGDTAELVPAIREAVNAVHPDIPTAGPGFWNEVHSLDEYRARSVQVQRFATSLIAAFAGIALALALVGLFAVLAYMVAQRTREIGVRMAIGARPADAGMLVLRQSARLVMSGLAAGIAAAIPATRLLDSLLFGVARMDPVSYVLPAVLFTVTAAIAAYLPARRAAGVDPLLAIRME